MSGLTVEALAPMILYLPFVFLLPLEMIVLHLLRNAVYSCTRPWGWNLSQLVSRQTRMRMSPSVLLPTSVPLVQLETSVNPIIMRPSPPSALINDSEDDEPKGVVQVMEATVAPRSNEVVASVWNEMPDGRLLYPKRSSWVKASMPSVARGSSMCTSGTLL